MRDLDRDGQREFVSGDNRFAYEFASFADSAWPVQIWGYRSGRFREVTRRFPRAIAADARRLWRYALATPRSRTNYGLLAAWAGDRCLLERCAGAFARLEAFRRTGRLRGQTATDPSPERFFAHLRRFLRRTGYLRR